MVRTLQVHVRSQQTWSHHQPNLLLPLEVEGEHYNSIYSWLAANLVSNRTANITTPCEDGGLGDEEGKIHLYPLLPSALSSIHYCINLSWDKGLVDLLYCDEPELRLVKSTFYWRKCKISLWTYTVIYLNLWKNNCCFFNCLQFALPCFCVVLCEVQYKCNVLYLFFTHTTPHNKDERHGRKYYTLIPAAFVVYPGIFAVFFKGQKAILKLSRNSCHVHRHPQIIQKMTLGKWMHHMETTCLAPFH